MSRGPSTTSEIGARGVLITGDHGVHVLLLVNGHTMNEQWDGTAYFERGTGIPFELIDHIEVILGPGSVLYGSNAMLGVINIVTKRAKDFAGTHLVVESEVPISIRGGAGFGREFRLFGQPAEVTAAVEYYGQKGPTFTLGPQYTGTTAPYAVDGRGKPGVWGGYPATEGDYAFMPTTYLRLLVGDLEINARAEIWKRQSPWSYGPYDDPGGYELESWLMLDVRHRLSLGSWVELSSRLYADSYGYTQVLDQPNPSDCPVTEPDGCTYHLQGSARWGGLEEQITFDWAKDGRFPTLLGIDARLKDLGMRTDYYDDRTGDDASPAGVYPCADPANPRGVPCSSLGKQLAAYAEQKVRPIPRVGLSAGARLDLDDAYGARVSPRLAAAVSPWTGGTLKLIYSEAFRAPTVYERFYADGSLQVPAPSLGPETVRSFEGSIEHKGRAQRILLSIFGSSWHGLVSDAQLSSGGIAAAIRAGELPPGTTTAFQNSNVAALDNYGFSVTFDGSAVSGRLRYGLSFTGAYTREIGPDGQPEVLPVAAQTFGNARVSFDLGGPLPTLALVGRYAGKRPASQASPPLDAPPLGSMRLAITGKAPVVRGLSYGLSADYSFTAYAPYAIGPVNLPNGMSELMPLDRFRATLTLAYEIDP